MKSTCFFPDAISFLVTKLKGLLNNLVNCSRQLPVRFKHLSELTRGLLFSCRTKPCSPCPIEVKPKEHKSSFMSFQRIGAFFCLVLVTENENLKEKGSERKYISVAVYKASKSHCAEVVPVGTVCTRGQLVYQYCIMARITICTFYQILLK
jgi:hypothetical protein